MMVVGCSSSSKEDYIPSENAGKQALETALTAWQNGKPIERIENPDAVAVQPQDSEWQRGKKLVAFAIGDELPSSDGPKLLLCRSALLRALCVCVLKNCTNR